MKLGGEATIAKFGRQDSFRAGAEGPEGHMGDGQEMTRNLARSVRPGYFESSMENPRVRLGELLVRAGLITGRQLEEALAEQRRVGKRLGSLLAETGLVSETQVTQILSQQLSVPWVSLHHIDFSRELLDLVPVDAVERF